MHKAAGQRALSVISEQFTFSAQDVHPARRRNPSADTSTLGERVGQLYRSTTRSDLLLSYTFLDAFVKGKVLFIDLFILKAG